MNQASTCCRDLASGRGGVGSPFTRVIALDWYDGPRAGLARCAVCGREFRFGVLDERFEDDGSDLRVYSLATLPEGSLAAVVRALEATHQPLWPVWAPLWAFPDPAQQAKAESAIDRVLEQAGPPELAVATSDLASEIREARTITAADVAAVDDWIGLLMPAPSKS